MHPVLSIVLQRLALGLMTLFFVSIIIFMAIELLPGDFTQAVLGQAATEDTVAAFRRATRSSVRQRSPMPRTSASGARPRRR